MDGLGYRRFTVQWRGWHEPVMKEDAEGRPGAKGSNLSDVGWNE